MAAVQEKDEYCTCCKKVTRKSIGLTWKTVYSNVTKKSYRLPFCSADCLMTYSSAVKRNALQIQKNKEKAMQKAMPPKEAVKRKAENQNTVVQKKRE